MLVNPSIYNFLGRYNSNYDLRTLEKQNSYTSSSKSSGQTYKNSLTELINRSSLQKVSSFAASFKSDLNNLSEQAKKLAKQDSGVYDSRKAIEQSSAFDVSVKDGAKVGQFAFKVNQLATAQTNKSDSKAANAQIAENFSGTLNIKQNGKTTKLDLSLKSGETVAESYLRVAKEINNANTGVKASVVTDKQGYTQLNLTSKETGKSAAFEVSGSFADELKLNQNQENAQNLEYEVDGKAKESEKNEVKLDNDKVTVSAKAVNASAENVEIKSSSSSVVSSLKSFAESFNKFVNSQKNTDNPLTKSIVKQFTNTVEKSLNRMDLEGIKMDSSGNISVDESKLSKAVESDPEKVKEQLTKFDSMASNLSRKTEQVLSMPLKEVAPNYSNNNYPIKAFMYNYNATSSLNNINQLTNNGSIMDIRI